LDENEVFLAKNHITKLKDSYNEKHGHRYRLKVLQSIKAGRHVLTEKREGCRDLAIIEFEPMPEKWCATNPDELLACCCQEGEVMKNLSKCSFRFTRHAAIHLMTGTMLIVIFVTGCSSIWNASDLAVWVKERAVEQGCRRDTIELEEWYTETPEGNVWRGNCRDSLGNTKSFGINVDQVWKPSAS
jgi:hypothetical protein